ncbi:phytoene desaturase family protein [Kytococcus sedentarius]|uniref:phytoene desaturase family protein n=1 Tax=Kytococcus sedentarius TaxID=1276 RepID=UPI0035BBE4B3
MTQRHPLPHHRPTGVPLPRRTPVRGAGRTAAVVGSCPNGLAAAVALAQAGLEVTVHEAASSPGGALRSAPALGPGTVVDLGAGVHPFGVASPFFRSLGLERHGLEWVHPDLPLAHPLEDRPAALLHRDLQQTAEGLGPDGAAWRRLIGPAVADFDRIVPAVLGPMLRVPRHPVALARFGLRGLSPATLLSRAAFREDATRALFAGLAAHSVMPLHHPLTSVFGVLFGAAGHAVGWPVARGGSQAIADALVAELAAHGGRVVTGCPVTDLRQLADAHGRAPDVTMLDTTPAAAVALAGDRLGDTVRTGLQAWRHGPGLYKVDYLLDGPVPWADPRVAGAGTVHVGGTMEELATAEGATHRGQDPERPFVLVAQQSLFDAGRAPQGKTVLYAYAHLAPGTRQAAGPLIDAQIERFAPGFRDRVVARVNSSPADLQARNANLVGGDVVGGSMAGTQLVLRPRPTLSPYDLGPGLYLCSASAPPGGGVHGMAGAHAAAAALRDLGLTPEPLTPSPMTTPVPIPHPRSR